MPVPTSKSPEPEPALEAYYRQQALWDLSRYEAHADQRLRARVIGSLIEPNTESIIDVGCGNGFITRHLKAQRVVGLDPSEEALSQYDGEKVLAGADRIPFDSQSFDAVVCTEVLEHLSDEVLRKAVRELDRVARTYLVVGVPYRQNLLEGMTRCARCGTLYHIDLHQHTFRGPKDVQSLFPNFTVQAAAFVGNAETSAIPGFCRLRHWMLGPVSTSNHARCPKCGDAEQRIYRHEAGRKFRRWLLDGIAWRFRRRTAANWMILLLKREKTT